MENSIKEDIKKLESIVKVNNDFLKGVKNQTINQKEITALQHILSDYKRVLKEANRYKNMYKVEHAIHLVRNEQLDRKENAITRCNELENENKKLKEMHYKFAKLILENFVSVRKIERQIEILDDNINTYNNTQRMFEKFLYAKKVLKGLLKNTEYTKKEV